MKITLTTAELPESLWQEFAERFCGWTPKIMTVTESPNYEIDNPVTFENAIKLKYYTPIVSDIARFNLSEAETLAQSKITLAQNELETAKQAAVAQAETIISFIVE